MYAFIPFSAGQGAEEEEDELEVLPEVPEGEEEDVEAAEAREVARAERARGAVLRKVGVRGEGQRGMSSCGQRGRRGQC